MDMNTPANPAVIFGADLRPGMVVNGHEIASTARSVRGEIMVRFTDDSQPRQFGWNQMVIR